MAFLVRPHTGDLYIGDVGQDSREEIDFARRGAAAGRDYGWSCWEGTRRYDASRSCPSPTGPVLDYGHANGECSVTGGVVVRDPRGAGAFRTLRVRRLLRGQAAELPDPREAGRPVTVGSASRVPSLSSFGEDARGRAYVTSLNGPVYRLRAR